MVGIWCRPASPYGMLQLPLFNWVYVASFCSRSCLLSRAHPIRLGLSLVTVRPLFVLIGCCPVYCDGVASCFLFFVLFLVCVNLSLHLEQLHSMASA